MMSPPLLRQQVPGFDHPVYPKGDPRATQLLSIARQRRMPSPQARAIDRFVDRMQADWVAHVDAQQASEAASPAKG